MKTLPVAIQLYSVRDEASNDLVNTLREIKMMGYDGVELAGMYGHTPEQLRDLLKEIGLVPISAHVPYDAFMQDLQGTIQSYLTIGCKYVAIPYLMEDSRYGTEKFTEFAKALPMIAKACKDAGLTLLYHNHDFEFLKTESGQYVLDYIFGLVAPNELMVELDTCWAKFSGIDPVGYLKKYSNRCPVVHLKDYNGAEPFEFRALGRGIQDMKAILAGAVEAGSEWVVVEQDRHYGYTPMEDSRISRVYLKELGW